jgi:hypothetical protein
LAEHLSLDRRMNAIFMQPASRSTFEIHSPRRAIPMRPECFEMTCARSKPVSSAGNRKRTILRPTAISPSRHLPS